MSTNYCTMCFCLNCDMARLITANQKPAIAILTFTERTVLSGLTAIVTVPKPWQGAHLARSAICDSNLGFSWKVN